MSNSRASNRIGITGAIVGAGVGAALGAITGATGAAIMTAAGWGGYVMSEATQMGALGSGILGAAQGLGIKYDSATYLLSGDSISVEKVIIHFVANQVIGSLIGYGILKGAVSMGIGATAAGSAVGSAVIGGGAGVALCVIACPIICCCIPLVKYCFNLGDNFSPSLPRIPSVSQWSIFNRQNRVPEMAGVFDVENPHPFIPR